MPKSQKNVRILTIQLQNSGQVRGYDPLRQKSLKIETAVTISHGTHGIVN